MTPSQLAQASGCSNSIAEVWADPLWAAMMQFGIASPQRAAMFIAQVGHECGNFALLTESLNYSVEALISTFSRQRISETDARALGRNKDHPADQMGIANRVYGGDWGLKNLGNREPGDGFMYRGRGAIQTTGRANYIAARDGLRKILGDRVPDFEKYPEFLTQPEWASYAAAFYWDSRKLNPYADVNDLKSVSAIINTGKASTPITAINGYQDRLNRYQKAMKVFA